MSEHAAGKLVDVEGLVKWFDPKKGFGFVVGPEGQDIFVHYTKIDGEGFRVLRDGSKVRYDAEKGEKGWHASRVVRLEPIEVIVSPRSLPHSRSPRR
ncbi:MAG: cold shock domain-containing protein [Phycisphaerae bacterium]|nr:cold shock domain-containing protein [Phycisphaerae bacterium]